MPTEHVVVRVIDYTVDDGRGVETVPSFSTVPVVHHDARSGRGDGHRTGRRIRAEVGDRAIFDELMTRQRGSTMVLRSKSPALVLQEIWSHLCCHYAIRTLMLAAAIQANVDPDRVSFVAALPVTRRSLAQARGFSLLGSDRGQAHALVLIYHRLNPKHRLRSGPRLIKRTMPKWHVKRARHTNWPQPTKATHPETSITAN